MEKINTKEIIAKGKPGLKLSEAEDKKTRTALDVKYERFRQRYKLSL
jgi:hypothetical protein